MSGRNVVPHPESKNVALALAALERVPEEFKKMIPPAACENWTNLLEFMAGPHAHYYLVNARTHLDRDWVLDADLLC